MAGPVAFETGDIFSENKALSGLQAHVAAELLSLRLDRMHGGATDRAEILPVSDLQHQRLTALSRELRLSTIPDLYSAIAQSAAKAKHASTGMTTGLPRWVHRNSPRAAPPNSRRSLPSARVPLCTTWTSAAIRALEQRGGSDFTRRPGSEFSRR